MTRRWIPTIVLTLVASVVTAQSRHTENTLTLHWGAARPPASIEEIAWLEGYWQGEAFGGTFEDVWSAPSAGTMMGMFKVVQDGEPSFYELQLIVEEKGSLSWLVKHFSDDFTAWEEKAKFVTFPLVRLTEDTAFFSGLTVRRVNADELRVFLAMRHADGPPTEVEMTYRRVGAEVVESGE